MSKHKRWEIVRRGLIRSLPYELRQKKNIDQETFGVSYSSWQVWKFYDATRLWVMIGERETPTQAKALAEADRWGLLNGGKSR